MKYLKGNWIIFVIMILICIVGGYFTTIYTLESFDQSIIEDAINQVGSKELFIGISVAQVSLYGAIFAGIGIILSNKIGLWKKFEINKKAILGVVIISIIGGLTLSIVDRYVFGSFIDPVLHSYDNKPTIEYIIASFTYGGVYEEILMRLFLMTLFSWIIAKIFYRKEKEIPVKVFIISNIVAALLFAAVHIPSTMAMTTLTPLLIFRCFLLNGLLGLCFGYLYRKHGIGYSMIAHGFAHLISDILMLIFI